MTIITRGLKFGEWERIQVPNPKTQRTSHVRAFTPPNAEAVIKYLGQQWRSLNVRPDIKAVVEKNLRFWDSYRMTDEDRAAETANILQQIQDPKIFQDVVFRNQSFIPRKGQSGVRCYFSQRPDDNSAFIPLRWFEPKCIAPLFTVHPLAESAVALARGLMDTGDMGQFNSALAGLRANGQWRDSLLYGLDFGGLDLREMDRRLLGHIRLRGATLVPVPSFRLTREEEVKRGVFTPGSGNPAEVRFLLPLLEGGILEEGLLVDLSTRIPLFERCIIRSKKDGQGRFFTLELEFASRDGDKVREWLGQAVETVEAVEEKAVDLKWGGGSKGWTTAVEIKKHANIRSSQDWIELIGYFERVLQGVFHRMIECDERLPGEFWRRGALPVHLLPGLERSIAPVPSVMPEGCNIPEGFFYLGRSLERERLFLPDAAEGFVLKQILRIQGVQNLENIWEQPPFYLFVGQAGRGKTALAKLIASYAGPAFLIKGGDLFSLQAGRDVQYMIAKLNAFVEAIKQARLRRFAVLVIDDAPPELFMHSGEKTPDSCRAILDFVDTLREQRIPLALLITHRSEEVDAVRQSVDPQIIRPGRVTFVPLQPLSGERAASMAQFLAQQKKADIPEGAADCTTPAQIIGLLEHKATLQGMEDL